MITSGEAKAFLDYNPYSGLFLWKIRAGARAMIGTEAGHIYNGYRFIKFKGRHYRAHRLAWLIVYGEWPLEIDHINGIRHDNRMKNLRVVTSQENNRNRTIPSNNTSGVMGVSWNITAKKWKAKIEGNGKQIYLGIFNLKEDAIKARKEAEIKYGYHPNHGRVA